MKKTENRGSTGASRFEYVAVDAKGKKQTGTLDATSEKDALREIKHRGLLPTSLTLTSPPSTDPSPTQTGADNRPAASFESGQEEGRNLKIKKFVAGSLKLGFGILAVIAILFLIQTVNHFFPAGRPLSRNKDEALFAVLFSTGRVLLLIAGWYAANRWSKRLENRTPGSSPE